MITNKLMVLPQAQPASGTLHHLQQDGVAALGVMATLVLSAIGYGLNRHFHQGLRRSEERHRVEAALSAQRVTREQNEALNEEIRERARIEGELRHAAYHDSLTGLHNRAYLVEALGEILRKIGHRGAPQAKVLYLDLDTFKSVNDSLGHRMGDLLLIEVGRRLRRIVREGDVLVRVSGDEFALVLANVGSMEQATRLAHRLLAVIEEPFELAGALIPITASVGVCEVTAQYNDVEEILRDADTAMYRAKRGGGDQFVRYDASMQEDALAMIQKKVQLKAGITNQEFELFYQPLIDLESRAIYGMEALIRWNHPTRGFLAPGHFIQLAEDTGHIVALGLWVMNEACKQLARFQKSSRTPLLMSFNVSSKQLDVDSFLDDLKAAIQHSGVNPAWLQMEITESIFLRDANRLGQLFQDIRDLGVQIAFDDFGTGYSSLSYLEKYPIDTLKLDQSFVQNMGEGSVNAEIIRMVINLAEAIGMKTSAEGVEEEHQAVALVELGCTLAQGYLFSKPVPYARMEQMILDSQDKAFPRSAESGSCVVIPFRTEAPANAHSEPGNHRIA